MLVSDMYPIFRKTFTSTREKNQTEKPKKIQTFILQNIIYVPQAEGHNLVGSEQLSCTRAAAFSQARLVYKGFWRGFSSSSQTSQQNLQT